MPENVQDYVPILSLVNIDGTNPVGYHFFRPAWVAGKTEITFLEMSGFGNHDKAHDQVLLQDFLNNWGAVSGSKRHRYGHCQVHFAPNDYWGKKIDVEEKPYYACLMV